MSTDSRLYSVVFNKCPRCHQGNFFVSNSAFSKNFDKMHEHCPHCGENFMPEPGFYWASMFVSYAFYTIYTLLTFFIVVQWLQIDVNYYLIGLMPTLILLTPYFFRMARRTWLTLFIAPKPQHKTEMPTQG
ncbi:DUF983 domain-containing protein [Spirosoma sp. HMF3257]|uniref:DUF983 domain-containing protein n=2 Tax=Spirosoma telluris TaxID=2183553 RepID=A0A327NQ92_9BACT|nr:DUF983 domain-containing protein [Spirosoma telluris]RAI77591.1 DUF983 domain-containing protein [Spirosoma telluris]